jgi:pyridoxal phosphate enzyme (YggS family)
MIKDRLEAIRQDIQRYSPHPDRVRIVAVSKKQPIDLVREGIAAGVADIGENRIQDALDKFAIEAFPGITRHFIGYLQSNKVNKCLQNFDWLHSLQTEKLAKLIANSEYRIKCLIEVNISGEENKSGCRPEELAALVKKIREFDGLEVYGLMGMAAFTQDDAAIRGSFRLLKELADHCRPLETQHMKMDELSMGMTHDYRIALEEGSTMVRIGTGIFGPRRMN